jgi:hypothetical protein
VPKRYSQGVPAQESGCCPRVAQFELGPADTEERPATELSRQANTKDWSGPNLSHVRKGPRGFANTIHLPRLLEEIVTMCQRIRVFAFAVRQRLREMGPRWAQPRKKKKLAATGRS